MSKSVGVIICAAGASSRFGGSTLSTTLKTGGLTAGGKRKKPFVDVAGRAVFLRSVELFAERDQVKQIILAISPEDEELVKVKWGPNLSFHGIKICFGGRERFETVANALKLIGPDIELIAVHDAVRCCLTKEWLDEVISAAEKTGAAILACPVIATLKKAENQTIIQTVDRTGLYEAQTPQVFRADWLKKAYENLKNLDESKISDDSQLIEAMGHEVAIVETSPILKLLKKAILPSRKQS